MLAKTPPMGWNSWNTFTKDINEQLIFDTADKMVSEGLLDAGYEYLVIDDCWSEKQRDENGQLVADHIKFPHGMKYVADYVHSKGLKFGMYSCCGLMTCAGYPASFGHEFDDANYFASVGVDYLKYDNCYHPSSESKLSYARMSIALRQTGRDIIFSLCNWGNAEVWKWARSVGGHLYRSTGDIMDSFESIKRLSNSQKENLGYSAPGCFNDIDMLVAGMSGTGNISTVDEEAMTNGEQYKGCTDGEYRYHFAMWCMFSAPLMIGCDVRNMSPATKALLLNRELIAINQDEDARQPIFIGDNHGLRDNTICVKFLSDGTYAVGMFNVYDRKVTGILPYYEMGLDPLCGYALEYTDVFTGENLGVRRDYGMFEIEPHDCRVFRARLVKVK